MAGSEDNFPVVGEEVNGEPTFDEVWADVSPVPQDDGPSPVVKIAYSSSYVKLNDLFRAVVQRQEYSDRVLDLTEELLELNASSYTVWQYRRDCLQALNKDLNEELDYLDTFARENPKNYQIWHHRRCIVQALGKGNREMGFCEAVFTVDAKNYHAWAHRQWALQMYNLWDGELEYVERCLDEDVRNNSAWNQRWFVVHKGPTNNSTTKNTADTTSSTSTPAARSPPITNGSSSAAALTAASVALPMQVLKREVDFGFAALQTVSLNESAWNYIRGLHRYHSMQQIETDLVIDAVSPSASSDVEIDKGNTAGTCGSSSGISACKRVSLHSYVRMKIEELLAKPDKADTSKSAPYGKNIFAMGLLADICEFSGSSTAAASSSSSEAAAASAMTATATAAVADLQYALELCTQLVSLDQIRAKSWTRRALALKQKLQ